MDIAVFFGGARRGCVMVPVSQTGLGGACFQKN